MVDGKTIQDRIEMTKEFFESEWYVQRPDNIKKLFDKHQPFNTYKLCNNFVFLEAFNEHEDGVKCVVNILSEVNRGMMLFSRRVFGVDLEELEDLGITEPWLDVLKN